MADENTDAEAKVKADAEAKVKADLGKVTGPRIPVGDVRRTNAQQNLPMKKVVVKYGKGLKQKHTIEVAEDVAAVYEEKMNKDGNPKFVKVGK